MEIKTYLKESGHWYTRSGEPMYTVKANNGQQRNTTLRDARKYDLVPSVTTIINVAAFTQCRNHVARNHACGGHGHCDLP